MRCRDPWRHLSDETADAYALDIVILHWVILYGFLWVHTITGALTAAQDVGAFAPIA